MNKKEVYYKVVRENGEELYSLTDLWSKFEAGIKFHNYKTALDVAKQYGGFVVEYEVYKTWLGK